jgi:putative two-component system response regulator
MTQTILIVDDSPDGIMLAELALSMMNLDARTESACSGERALELLAAGEHLPDLILLDLKMPGIGGIATLKKIRADERLRNIPVVVTTLSTLESDVAAAQQAGANAFVHKAIRMHEFKNDLEHHVKCWINPKTAAEHEDTND